MNKTTNMVIFFAIATVFNIALMIGLLVAIMALSILILGNNPDPTVFQIVLFVGFLASIVLTFLTYGWLLKKVQKKIDLEKLVPQLFRPKRK
jgi:hypothetical protein